MKVKRLGMGALAFWALLHGDTLFAQDANGRVIGTVTDPQGAMIAGANITITEVSTKTARTTKTGNDGSYQVLELPIGNYSVTAEQSGFSTAVTDPQKLLINQSLRVDITMRVGNVSETVQVNADSASVETVNATLGGSVTSQNIPNLPLNGRNTLDLALLQPGVTPSNSGTTTGGGKEFNIAGGRQDSITFLLDGGINNNLLSNGVVFTPNPDAVSEFRILTSNYTAEYGRNGGGIVSEVIRSGTNQLHGSAYDFVRNQDFNANLFFNNVNNISVPVLKRNQFGATVGGPIVLPKIFDGRNKLFFFVAYQAQRQVATTTNAAITVFTPAELKGDFSHSVNGGPDLNVAKFLQQNPYFQGNSALAAQGVIDSTKIDPVAANYIKAGLIPSASAGQLIPSGGSKNNSDDLIEKVDYSATANDRISVTLSSGRNPTLTPFAGTTYTPGLPYQTTLNRYHGVVDYTRIFSSNLINDLRFTAQRNHQLQSAPAVSAPTSNQLGINIISDDPTGPSNLSFVSGSTVGFSVQGPTSLIDNTFDLSDVLTWTRGKHSMKTGFTVQPYQNNTKYDFYINGNFFFDGASGGIGANNDKADFLFGLPDEYLQYGAAPSNVRSKYYAGFVQDEWRVNRHLTLTLGLRYDYSEPKYDTQGRSFSMKYGTQSTVFPGAPIGLLFPGDKDAPRGSNFADKNNFSPRFGFAYSPGTSAHTSIRGGVGVFYDILKAEDNLQYNGQAPFFGFSDLVFDRPATGPYNLLSNPFAAAGTPNPFPSTPPPHNLDFAAAGDLPIGGAAVYYVNPNIRTPYIYQYNLSVQHQFDGDVVLEVNYVGSSSHKLTGLIDANPILKGGTARLFSTQPGASDANYSYLDTFDNVGRAHYNSLQASLQKRLTNTRFVGNTFFQLSYTYGHSIDNESGFRETNSRVPYYNQKQFMASSDYDLRHVISFSGGWELPFEKAWESGPKRLTKGWTMYPIVSYRTGFPLDISAQISRTRTRIGPSGAGDPNLVRANLLTANVPTYDPRNRQVIAGRTGSYYFAPTDFGRFTDINNNQNTYGTLGRNAFYGPGRANVDLSMVKVTPIWKERVNLEFRADFFNLFNHAEFSNPNLTITSSTFGQITSTADPRIIQLALHLTF